jgi:hypothetical protein
MALINSPILSIVPEHTDGLLSSDSLLFCLLLRLENLLHAELVLILVVLALLDQDLVLDVLNMLLLFSEALFLMLQDLVKLK